MTSSVARAWSGWRAARKWSSAGSRRRRSISRSTRSRMSKAAARAGEIGMVSILGSRVTEAKRLTTGTQRTRRHAKITAEAVPFPTHLGQPKFFGGLRAIAAGGNRGRGCVSCLRVGFLQVQVRCCGRNRLARRLDYGCSSACGYGDLPVTGWAFMICRVLPRNFV